MAGKQTLSPEVEEWVEALYREKIRHLGSANDYLSYIRQLKQEIKERQEFIQKLEVERATELENASRLSNRQLAGKFDVSEKTIRNAIERVKRRQRDDERETD